LIIFENVIQSLVDMCVLWILSFDPNHRTTEPHTNQSKDVGLRNVTEE